MFTSIVASEFRLSAHDPEDDEQDDAARQQHCVQRILCDWRNSKQMSAHEKNAADADLRHVEPVAPAPALRVKQVRFQALQGVLGRRAQLATNPATSPDKRAHSLDLRISCERARVSKSAALLQVRLLRVGALADHARNPGQVLL